jgi:hypothetical protein
MRSQASIRVTLTPKCARSRGPEEADLEENEYSTVCQTGKREWVVEKREGQASQVVWCSASTTSQWSGSGCQCNVRTNASRNTPLPGKPLRLGGRTGS